MKIAQKFPINPNIIMFLVTEQQTTKMSEFYSDKEKAKKHSFAWRFLEIPEIRRIQITRYEIRIFKHKTCEWQQVLPQISTIINSTFPHSDIIEFSNSETNEFEINYNTKVKEKEIYEGVEIAEKSTIAKKIFTIPGVERVVLDETTIQVKKSSMFSAEVWTQVKDIVSN